MNSLRSTSWFGVAGVPNTLNLELNLFRLLEVALVSASWRVVLHCNRRNAFLHNAWLVLRVGVLYCIVVEGDPRTSLLHCARPHRCAWLSYARKRAVCIVVGREPGPLSLSP